MVGLLFIIEMANARDERVVTIPFSPINRLFLRFVGSKHLVRMVLDDIIVDRTSLRPAFGAGFNIDVRHTLAPCKSSAAPRL
jgi:hypothetical protein